MTEYLLQCDVSGTVTRVEVRSSPGTAAAAQPAAAEPAGPTAGSAAGTAPGSVTEPAGGASGAAVAPGAWEGRPFPVVVTPDCFQRALSFLSEVHSSGVCLGREMDVPSEQGPRTLTFHGIAAGPLRLISAAEGHVRSLDVLISATEKLPPGLSGAAFAALARALAAPRSPGDEAMLNELSRINNELATLHRDLARKNRRILRMRHRLLEAQKMQTARQIVAGTAHAVNNALMSIQAGVDLVSRTALGHQMGQLGSIRGDVRRTADLTHRLLAFTQARVWRPQTVDLGEVAKASIARMARDRSDRSVTLRPAAARPLVRGDPEQLDMAVYELLLNAFEAAAPDGSVSVTLTVGGDGPGPHGGASVRLEVSDNGPGMDEAVKRRLFTPFNTTKFLGRGLGLAAAHGIVRAHEGEITVESAPGAGTTVRIRLPLAEDPPDGPETPPASSPGSAADTPGISAP